MIEMLQENGRESFREIAKKLGVSTKTAIRRYERLRQSGLLKVTIEINLSKVGYKAYAIFGLSFDPGDSRTLIKKALSEIPDVFYIIQIIGQYDFSVAAVIKDVDHLLQIQDQIARVGRLRNFEINIVSEEETEGYRPIASGGNRSWLTSPNFRQISFSKV